MFGRNTSIIPYVHMYILRIFRLNFSLPLCQLPLETRVCFTIHGNESLARKPIGWVAMPIFNINRYIMSWCVLSSVLLSPPSLDNYKQENITCVCGQHQREQTPLVHVILTHQILMLWYSKCHLIAVETLSCTTMLQIQNGNSVNLIHSNYNWWNKKISTW